MNLIFNQLYKPTNRLRVLRGVAVLLLISLFLATGQSTASPQPAFPIISLEPYASGLVSPTFVTSAGDGTGRLFVVEQGGQIQIIESGQITGTFLNISAKVSPGSERGLLGMAFPPGYSFKQWFYVFYTRLDGDIVVARYHVSADPDLADPSSEQIMLIIEHSENGNHNGGMLAFGPDGYLYIGVGDGGGGGDPDGNGQDTQTLLGKILRIDVENDPGLTHSQDKQPSGQSPRAAAVQVYLPILAGRQPPSAYLIPPDNPFANGEGGLPEIWAYGLRNPWRFSFDPLTGELYIGDVGQDAYEEIDYQPAGQAGGANYGWNVMEGPECYNAPTCTEPPNYVAPVAWYPHSDPGSPEEVGCSVTGGYVYFDTYFFADFCSGRVWGMTTDNVHDVKELLNTDGHYSTFGMSENGELYIADIVTGEIFQVVATQ